MKCIRERILTENIAFHLLLDIGNFYSKDSINAVRYSNETLEFWLTVQKLFKGKGVNLCINISLWFFDTVLHW
jgi:hypothetical protein